MEWKTIPQIDRENIQYIDIMGKIYAYNNISIIRKNSYNPWKTTYSFTIYGKIRTVEADYIDGPEIGRDEFMKAMNEVMDIIDFTLKNQKGEIQ